MTVAKSLKNKKIKTIQNALACILVLTVVILSFAFAKEIKMGVLFGMRIAALDVIPAVFPFFVLSDYLYTADFFRGRIFGSLFCRPFCLHKRFARTLILACFFGFPIGAKCCAEEYKYGASENDTETAVCLSSNPSAAFCIFAVGMGCLDSIRLGVLLFLSMISATFITGILFRRKNYNVYFSREIAGQRFDFSVSIKSAGIISVSVCSFIMFFSAVISLTECFVKNTFISATLSSFFEVGNACARIANLSSEITFKIALLGFALGFSGLSVILQAKAALPPQIKLKKLPIFKLTEGCICALISQIFYTFSQVIIS